MSRRLAATGKPHRLCVVALLLGVLLADAALAQQLIMSGALDLTQNYRPGAIQFVRFDLRNESGRDIEGSVVLPLTADQAPATMKLPVMVPAHSIVWLRLAGYFPRLEINSKRKQQDVPPLATAEFRAPHGAMLARTPIMGLPITSRTAQGEEEKGEIILLVNERGTASKEHDIESLAALLSDQTDVPLTVATIELAALTHDPQALRPVKAVVLAGVDPAAVDLGQREALLTYLRGGGVVVLSAPGPAATHAGAWLKPLLPVEIIGTRQATQINVTVDGPTLKLQTPVEVSEALDAGGEVMLRDRDYINVATKKIGLGKVVFTSFPINALDQSQPQVVILWGQLLKLDHPQWEWNRSQLATARHPVLGSMIGRKVAPWTVAAALAGGYLLIIVLAQTIFTGPSRPRAVAVSLAAAILTSLVLVAMGITRHADETLQAARLSIIDLSADGGGWRNESLAYLGIDDPALALQAAGEHVAIRPALSAPTNRPTIRQYPFAVENAGAFPERIERVWEASAPVDPSIRLAATAMLTSDGLTVDVDNQLGKSIESPLVIFNGRALAIENLSPGQSTARQSRLNPRGHFTGLGTITSDQAKRRAQVIAASLAPANSVAPGAASRAAMLIGWIADGPRPLLAPQGKTPDMQSMDMVRTPLGFRVPPVGSAVTADRALVYLDTGQLPFEPEKGESVPTTQDGAWQISFLTPPQFGIVKPARITISARVALPAHTLRLTMGGATGEWNRTAGVIERTFDCTAADFDARGRIRTTLEIHAHDPTGPAQWQISDLGAKIEGTVVGPAPAITFDVPPATTKEDQK